MNLTGDSEETDKRGSHVLDLGSRLELFVDRYLIDSSKGVRLELHPPTPREVAIQFDAPWEGPTSTYVTVMQDVDRCRAYYRGKSGGADGVGEVTCYAESSDGITWSKPTLGICEYNGSKENNIIWEGFGACNFMAFKDANPSAPEEALYKAIPTGPPTHPIKRIIALASPDGIHWRQMHEEPIITQRDMDSGADLAFWDTEQRQYVAYIRGQRAFRSTRFQSEEPSKAGPPRFRQVLRATSADFSHWSEPAFVDFGDTPLEHFYTNAVTPYFGAPHIYLSFPMRFVPERQKVDAHPVRGVADAVLMSSRDGMHFDRPFMESFIRPGRDLGNWTDRNNMPAWGLVATAQDEISLYYVEHYRHATCRLRRATLRTDGFVSVHAGYVGGEFVTKPLLFQGSELVINYVSSAAGSVRVEVRDSEDRAVEGFRLEQCPEIYGDEIEHTVTWEAGSDVSRFVDQPVRLRFLLKDADVYSLRFR